MQECDNSKINGGCPLGFGANGHLASSNEKNEVTYSSYLHLDKLLSCQVLVECGKYSHDQHLFIITHQVYELWFKQIIFEIDSINSMFRQKVSTLLAGAIDSLQVMDERNMRVIINRLHRIVLILKVSAAAGRLESPACRLQSLVEQISILETMTAIDFMDFRFHLQASSGSQSLQFRLLENKLGVVEESRVRYNKSTYKQVFESEPAKLEQIIKSQGEDSLQVLLERWLERTPGCNDEDSQFWQSYCDAVKLYLKECFEDPILRAEDAAKRRVLEANWIKEKKSFETIMNEDQYNELVKRGEKRFSHKAFKGAMMISLYRDETRFSQPYQMLSLILDVDAHFTKWRYNHVIMVQRMIGSKLGSGGSSGYQYLRATVSDRYMPFCDLCNLTTYLIPKEYTPVLSSETLRKLSQL